jgi:thioredoxin reductase
MTTFSPALICCPCISVSLVVVRPKWAKAGNIRSDSSTASGATLRYGERIALSYLYLFLGAAPRTAWLGGAVALDEDGFILTGPRAGAEGILETSVPSVFAVGDVRSGSVKRCVSAVGEGAIVVRFVHERFSGDSHDGPSTCAGIAPAPRQ